MSNKELKKYFIDICARMSQVIFTLLVVTPFIANIFNWTLIIAGIGLFLLVTLAGAVIAGSIREETNG